MLESSSATEQFQTEEPRVEVEAKRRRLFN